MTNIDTMRAAKLMVITAALYSKRIHKKVTRVRFSRNFLLLFLNRNRSIPSDTMVNLQDDLLELGWTLIDTGDDTIAMMQAPKVKLWTQISSKVAGAADEPDIYDLASWEIDAIYRAEVGKTDSEEDTE